MGRDHIVVMSDLHIGVGAPTNWYQRDLHEPMLLAAFDWIVAQADSIAELVLLGDVTDQWSYVPSQRPPGFAEVAAANPAIFAPHTGALARALTALDGAVTYVPGNHDMSVTAADVATIVDRGGRAVRYETEFPYVPAAGRGKVACAHGHQFSVFNAPDHVGDPAGGLPLGYLVTRLGALWTQQHLTPGQRACDVAGAGEPTGWVFEKDELVSLASGVLRGKDSLAQLVLGALLRATGQNGSLPVTLGDGSTITVDEGIRRFSGVFHRFEATPGGSYGHDAALFALLDTDLRNNLDHFARDLGKRHPVVVLGHTHTAADQTERPLLVGPSSVYANSGFQCPARPDFERPVRPRRPTFVAIQVDDAAARLVVNVHAVESSPAGPRVSTAPAFSVVAGG
jgi:predicted phosphodiesterase